MGYRIRLWVGGLLLWLLIVPVAWAGAKNWSVTGTMATARAEHTATPLSYGNSAITSAEL